ncbi:MAG: protein-L-isoaspartate O-methyltransferase [Candidatus Diapherotrites archaeon]|nr:protein-L-isoaspartate O-methyltransferase [Candidatus Diapherotrites archaeon]
MAKDDFFRLRREQLVQYMLASGAIKSDSVKNAFLNVKRENFMPAHLQSAAYSDEALPIGSGQTISQPSTIATMLELLQIQEGNKVLEIGAGSAYVLALLSELAGKKGKIYGIEILPELKRRAEKVLEKCNYKNVKLKVGDGTLGWKEKAQFERILLSAACPYVPKKGQVIKEEFLENYFAFVPLRGKYGWG